MYNSRRPERVYGCKLNCDEGGSAPFVHPVPGSTSDDDVLPLLGEDEDAIIYFLGERGLCAGGVPALLALHLFIIFLSPTVIVPSCG